MASYLFEKSVLGDDSAADGFVAGFSQSNMGDVSPNVLGAWCEDGSGDMCTLENSTCGGDAKMCHSRGPFFRIPDQGALSWFEIGRRQFEPAKALYDSLVQKPRPLRGSWVKSFHTFHDMSGFSFMLPNGSEVQTCPAALGYSFAAGTSDGPGAFDFTQHESNESNTNPFWRAVSHFMKEPSDEQRACQGAEPILMDVGEMESPYMWAPNLVDVQVFRIGSLVIIVSPGEATTMAGRRWKEAVKAGCATAFGEKKGDKVNGNSGDEPVVVLGGPANSYAHYITTEEEYAIQRYEGASTLYGPHTLAAYVNVTLSFLPYLASTSSEAPSPPDAFPPDNANRSLSFITGVIRDGSPLFHSFGDVTQDVGRVYRRGAWIGAKFVGANPRNNLRLEDTYAAVENMRAAPRGAVDWIRVRDDADWSLIFRWTRTSELMATSEVEIVWETEDWAEPGVYRIRYFGDAKSIGGHLTPFEGTSALFTLL